MFMDCSFPFHKNYLNAFFLFLKQTNGFSLERGSIDIFPCYALSMGQGTKQQQQQRHQMPKRFFKKSVSKLK